MRIHHAQPGMVLAQDVVDNSGTLLLEKGIALTETYIQRLKKIGIVQIRIQDGQAATLKQQKVILTSSVRNWSFAFAPYSACKAAVFPVLS